MNFKKIVASGLMAALAFGMVVSPAQANEPSVLTPQSARKTNLEVERIVANTRVGDGGQEVVSFEITVSDEAILSTVSATDFDIENQISVMPIDIETGQMAEPYADDGIQVSVDGNTLKLTMTPFNYNGTYNGAGWRVTNDKYPELSFTSTDVDTVNTQTLDEFKRGTFTYAGITREYALYVPADAKGPVPLVVWNHGGGEYGIDIEKTLIANRGVTAWPEAGYQTAVLMIQVSNANYGYGAAKDPAKQSLIDQNNALQAALIRKLITDGTVDENRVYVTGASSGGGATMRFLMQYPELFAGAIACCSMDPIVSVHKYSGGFADYDQLVQDFEAAFQGSVFTWDDSQQKMVTKQVDTQELINVPIYFTHAQNDQTCQSTSSQAMYDAFRHLGDTNNRIVLWTDEEMAADGISNAMNGALLHWSWVKVLNHHEDGSPMNWMFQQTRNTAPTEKETIPFTLHAHVFDYGEAIDQVQIDLSSVLGDRTIDTSALTTDMFQVAATATDPYNSNAVLYEDVARTVTSVSVENGIVTLNLACQYNGQGQSTLNYSLDAGRNLSADVAYDITLTKDIALSDSSTIAKDALSFSQDEIFNEETAAFTAGNSDGLNYQLYVPENAADGKDHPLIVWFHGGGEGGYGEAQNNTSQLRANRGALGFAEEGAQQIFGGAYVLAPQSPNSWSRDGQESLDHATALINTIVNTYNIDADRIYVAGCSDGGWMTVNMAIENPELFAAIVPICAAFGSSTDEELLTLKDNNIWMVHALNDTSVEPENTSDRLHALIPSSIYTVYDTVTVDGVNYPGHWSWIYVARNMPTHNGQSIFQWMASKTLADDPITDVEQPGNTETPDKIVQTSDNQMIYPYIGLMLLAVVGMGGYVVARRQRKQEDMQSMIIDRPVDSCLSFLYL